MEIKQASRFGFFQGLIKAAQKNERVLVLDADLPKTTGSYDFGKVMPEKLLNVGIAEQNMVGMAAGLSKTGLIPFCCSMAVFSAGRAFEIIRNGVAYSSLNVKIVGSHGGITAAGDGGTHQCIEDIAIMRSLPNMVVLSPCDSNQAAAMAQLMVDYKGPMYIRTSREPTINLTSEDDIPVLGKAQKLVDGKDLCIIATGMMTVLAKEAIESLGKEGFSISLLNIHTIKPFDSETVREEVAKCSSKVLVCEEANVIGGLGDAVARALVTQDVKAFDEIGINDRFGQTGKTSVLLDAYGITSTNIAAKARELINR